MANRRFNTQTRKAAMGGGMMRKMYSKGTNGNGKPGEGPKDMGSPKTKSISSDGKRRRMKFGGNGKPVSKSKNPGLAKMAKSPKGKAAVKKMGFNPNRMVAKKGGRA